MLITYSQIKMDVNKPNQTDPSTVEASVEPEKEITLDDLIKERVAEAVAAQKPAEVSQEAPKEATKQGGSGSDVSTQKDSSSVTDPNAEVLKFVEGFSGRKFESIEEASKFAKNLNSLVGDNAIAEARKDAKVFNNLAEKFATSEGKTLEDAKKFLAETLISKATAEPVKKNQPETPVEDKRVDKIAPEVETLKTRLDKADLLAKYPYAVEVAEEIAIIAKQKGISQIEAFEGSPLKALAEAKAKEESRKSPVVTSSNRIGFDQQKVQDLGKKVLKQGKEEDKIALVKATLGLK